MLNKPVATFPSVRKALLGANKIESPTMPDRILLPCDGGRRGWSLPILIRFPHRLSHLPFRMTQCAVLQDLLQKGTVGGIF